MAKFVYSMQNILDIKYKLEAQARSDYAVAAAKLAEEEEKLAALYLRKRQYEQQTRELLNGTINVNEIKLNKKSITTIKSLIRNQSINVHLAQKNLEVERQRLSEVMIDRKTHEKLKENRFEEFVREQYAAENNEVDQLVSYTFHKE